MLAGRPQLKSPPSVLLPTTQLVVGDVVAWEGEWREVTDVTWEEREARLNPEDQRIAEHMKREYPYSPGPTDTWVSVFCGDDGYQQCVARFMGGRVEVRTWRVAVPGLDEFVRHLIEKRKPLFVPDQGGE